MFSYLINEMFYGPNTDLVTILSSLGPFGWEWVFHSWIVFCIYWYGDAGAGIWAVYPIIFSISYFCGVFNITIALILSISTLSSFCLSAFQPAGVPPLIVWGSYPAVGQGGLDNYTFCHFCSKPKSPKAHHCRSCGTCILDMDHHCPFVRVLFSSKKFLFPNV